MDPVFNRALWHEYMSLPDEARRDWMDYLNKDPGSKWANEARQRLQAIEEKQNSYSQTREEMLQSFIAAYHDRDDQKAWQAFSRSRTRIGNTITERLLSDYLESSATGRSDEANNSIQMLSYAGALEYRRVGDPFTKELAEIYRLATPARQRLISRARELMRSAYESSRQTEYEKAVESFSQARRLFESSGDYCEASFAEIWIANCNLRIRPDRSIPIFSRLSREFERDSFKWLLAQALYGLSDAQSSKRDFTKTLEYSDRSSRLLSEVEDPGGVLRNMQFPVAMHQQYGEYAKSIRLIMRAFDHAATFSPEPQDLWTFYQQAAVNFNSMGYPTLALSFEQTALNLARELATPIYLSRSYALLGLIHQGLRDYEQAIVNARLALFEGDRIGGERSRNNLIANSTLNLAHIYREAGDFSNALECYNRAIKLHATLQQDIYIFQAHRGKLLSLIALNDDPSVSEEIRVAVGLIEEYRPKIQEENSRNNFFDLAQSIYDIAIDYAFSKMNDDDAAFNYSEQSRARSLLDLLAAGSQLIGGADAPEIRLDSVARPLEHSEIMRRLPHQAQLLQYAVLDDKLLVWVISKDSFQSRRVSVTANQIGNKTERFLDLLAKKPHTNLDDVISCAKELYESLIAPVEPLLDRQKQLYIIPDKELYYIPFGALYSPTSNRFLVEDFALAFSPSSSVFIKCSETAVKKAKTGDERLLSIGNPRFDPGEFQGLSDLPSAATEAREVAGFYRLHSILVEEDATPNRVKSKMAKADVIHYAGHYVVNAESPMLSRLALAPAASGTNRAQRPKGYITASEIYGMELPQVKVVILAACRTGIERSYKGEGAISIARPFIKSGAPIVIASLWPVETEPSAELMVNFHRHRMGPDVPSIEALRRAQIDMIRNKASNYNHPFFWASFAVIGGSANF
jgi:CHAT domain-containing protein/tetratricopeptide (TPR) repeat protein